MSIALYLVSIPWWAPLAYIFRRTLWGVSSPGTRRSSWLAALPQSLTPVLHAEPPRDRGEAAPSMGWPRSEGRAQ